MSRYDDNYDDFNNGNTVPHEPTPQPTVPHPVVPAPPSSVPEMAQPTLPPAAAPIVSPTAPPATEPVPPTATSAAPYQQPVYQSPYVATAAPNPRPRRRINRGCLGCLIFVIGLFGVASCVFLLSAAIIWSNLSGRLSAQLTKAQQELAKTTFQTTHVYDRNGALLHELFDQGRRTNVKLADVPKVLIDATLGTEDNTFYDNSGVDLTAITRAALELVTSSARSSGGSTITQQLVRDIAFSYEYRNERSFQRKGEEIIMSLILTRQMSKDKILELYLNQIYYGNLAYGIEAASQTYFGKHASQLNLAEASLLAGLPQAPAELDPLNPDPKVQDEVLQRRRTVLNLMVQHGRITQAVADAAIAQPLAYADPNVNLTNPHFTLYAEQELKNLITALNLPPSVLFTGGLTVYTTLDQRYQTLAEKTAQAQITAIAAQHNAHNAAVVILQPGTGEILAMMGSVNYNDASIQGKVNVATSAKQPGSAMKPLTYAGAMEKGFTAASILWDVQTRIGLPGQQPYEPTNYDHRYHGVVRVRDALANSYNVPAVETLRAIGVDYLLSVAQRFGVRSLGTDASKYGLSLTLGGGELTPLELTQAYSVFANGGQFVPATAILCILNGDGTIIYQYENGCPKGTKTATTISATASPKQVLDPRIAFVMADILGDNTARAPAMGGTSPLYTPKLPTSVKTGTTNDYRDNWTVGFTHNVAVGVWVGNTDDKPMINSSGLTGAAPIWHDVITGIYADPTLLDVLKRGGSLPSDALQAPPGLVRKQLCNLAALHDPATACAPGRAEWFLDSPPLVPDANGKLAAQPGVSVAPTQPPANGPRMIAIEPDVVQMLAQPLNGSFVIAPAAGNSGVPAAPPPLYCAVPYEVRDQVPSAQQLVFIKAPPFPDEDAFARIYAQNAGVPITPPVACTPDMLNANPNASGVVARITTPTAGDSVKGTVQVIGTVTFTPQQAVYYKVEIQGVQFPNWTTIGNTHNNSVINAPLEQFGATGLQPGQYQLRITVVGVDGNNLLSTGGTPITIAG